MSVKVISGANDPELPISGDSVADVRRRFGQMLNIAIGATATINGEPAEEDDVVYNGDVLRFVKATAEKG